MTVKQLVDEILGWIRADIEEGSCDPEEWIEDLEKVIEEIS